MDPTRNGDGGFAFEFFFFCLRVQSVRPERKRHTWCACWSACTHRFNSFSLSNSIYSVRGTKGNVISVPRKVYKCIRSLGHIGSNDNEFLSLQTKITLLNP